MTKYGNLFDAIGSFDMSLGKWQNDLSGVPSERYAKAAQIHVQRSRDWIRPFLETPEYTRMIQDDAVIKYLKNAVTIIGNPKRPAATGVLSTCAAIDEALKSTYEVVQRHTGKKDRANLSFASTSRSPTTRR